VHPKPFGALKGDLRLYLSPPSIGGKNKEEEITGSVNYQNILYLQKHMHLPAKYTSA
jgi:hypothetical protein